MKKFHLNNIAIILTMILCVGPIANANAEIAMGTKARSAAYILDMQPEVEKLIALKNASSDPTRDEEFAKLHVLLIKKVLNASLNVREATDRIDNELAREYTARGQMYGRRDRAVEASNAANFTQSGTIGCINGKLNLTDNPDPANYLDIITGGLTIGLATLSLWLARGGKRTLEARPNMLGQFLSVADVPSDHTFSPLIWKFLNTPEDRTTQTLSRRQWLIKHWREAKSLTINIDKPKICDKIAGCGPGYTKKAETTKLVSNRIIMLHDLHMLVESFDAELSDLMQALE